MHHWDSMASRFGKSKWTETFDYHWQYTISFKDVSFSYPARPDVPVSLSTTTNTAIVEASGAGKSSIVSLIERIYDPASGSVELDLK